MNSMGRLKGMVCIVTGVATPKGIGYGTAKVFAAEGAKVICVVRRPIVHERVKELTDAGYDAVGYVADLELVLPALIQKIKEYRDAS